MTAARRERKSPRGRAVFALILFMAATSANAATTELIVINRHTGLAIDGFDPVAYFADAKPQPGRAALEWRFGGATWRFHNEGNRSAFAAAPDAYAPRYGGYDPMALARGAPTAGNPEFWLITGRRLYLFYDDDDRAAFARDPEGAIAAAEREWPGIKDTLVRD
jgi:hypothetical protein